MHFLIGWLVAREVADAAGEANRNNNNALWGILLWIVIPALGAWGSASNFGNGFARAGAMVTFLLLLVFVLWKPLASHFKVMMLAAVQMVLGLVLLWHGGKLVLGALYLLLSGELKNNGLSNVPWASVAWSAVYVVGSILAWAVVEIVTKIDKERMERNALAHNDPNLLPIDL